MNRTIRLPVESKKHCQQCFEFTFCIKDIQSMFKHKRSLNEMDRKAMTMFYCQKCLGQYPFFGNFFFGLFFCRNKHIFQFMCHICFVVEATAFQKKKNEYCFAIHSLYAFQVFMDDVVLNSKCLGQKLQAVKYTIYNLFVLLLPS